MFVEKETVVILHVKINDVGLVYLRCRLPSADVILDRNSEWCDGVRGIMPRNRRGRTSCTCRWKKLCYRAAEPRNRKNSGEEVKPKSDNRIREPKRALVSDFLVVQSFLLEFRLSKSSPVSRSSYLSNYIPFFSLYLLLYILAFFFLV